MKYQRSWRTGCQVIGIGKSETRVCGKNSNPLFLSLLNHISYLKNSFKAKDLVWLSLKSSFQSHPVWETLSILEQNIWHRTPQHKVKLKMLYLFIFVLKWLSDFFYLELYLDSFKFFFNNKAWYISNKPSQFTVQFGPS